MVGSNNFPNSSNMCHESTSVALPQAIGAQRSDHHLQSDP
jgi:anaerobic selenocysteine-containing dehydrogenase